MRTNGLDREAGGKDEYLKTVPCLKARGSISPKSSGRYLPISMLGSVEDRDFYATGISPFFTLTIRVFRRFMRISGTERGDVAWFGAGLT